LNNMRLSAGAGLHEGDGDPFDFAPALTLHSGFYNGCFKPLWRREYIQYLSGV